jgi:peptidoglycan-associated lipoprotein
VLRTVYFGYNSEEIDDAGQGHPAVERRLAQANPSYTVEIGGHCDERGSIGYNVALGDRRAASVKDYLAGLGVPAAHLVSVSYGEERPAAQGRDESTWSRIGAPSS